MTLIEYVESVTGMKLLDFQKKYLQDVYQSIKRGTPLVNSYPRGHRMIEVNGLRTLVVAYCDKFENGGKNDT